MVVPSDFNVVGHSAPLGFSAVVAAGDPALGEKVAENLWALGHRVAAIAERGTEAVEQALRNRADFLLLDLHMPLLGGVNAIREVLKPHGILVVAFASEADIRSARIAAEMEVISFLVTPFDGAQLELALQVAAAEWRGGADPDARQQE